MKLDVIKLSIHRRRYLPDTVIVEAEVPGMDRTTKMELEVPEGTGLKYLQEHFSKGELGSYDLSVTPFKT